MIPLFASKPFLTVLLLSYYLSWFRVIRGLDVSESQTTNPNAKGQGSSSSSSSSSSSIHIHIEPVVRRYTNVFPPEVCRKIVELLEHKIFALDREPVDDLEHDVGDQQITVAQGDVILDPDIYGIMAPYMKKVTELVKAQSDPNLDKWLYPNNNPTERVPQLGDVFLRKYSPDSARNSLAVHGDLNLHTVNIALNDGFNGGGLFYVRPTLAKNPEWTRRPGNDNINDNNNNNNEEDGNDKQLYLLEPPKIDAYQEGYEFLRDVIPQQNTSDVIFPKQETGDALIHNYTVWHGVSAITSGVRYSVVIFYDEDNPMMSDDDDDDYYDNNDDDDDDDNADELTKIWIKHEIQECDPTTGKIVLVQYNIKLIRVNLKGEEMEIGATFLSPGEVLDGIWSVPGEVYRAFRSDPEGEASPHLVAGKVLASIVIAPDKQNYKFVSSFITQEDCDMANPVKSEEL